MAPTRMGASFQRIIEVLAMRCRAVDQSGAGSVQRSGVPYRRASAFPVPAVHQRIDVVCIPGGHAQSGHVDEIVDRGFACLWFNVAQRKIGKDIRNFFSKRGSLEACGLFICGSL